MDGWEDKGGGGGHVDQLPLHDSILSGFIPLYLLPVSKQSCSDEAKNIRQGQRQKGEGLGNMERERSRGLKGEGRYGRRATHRSRHSESQVDGSFLRLPPLPYLGPHFALQLVFLRLSPPFSQQVHGASEQE